MRGRDELVPTGVDAGRDAQHDPRALAQTARDRGDARRLVRLVDHDLRETFGDRELDLRVRLVVAVQHQAPPRHAGGERDAHLPHRARVHVEPRFGDDARHLFGEERLAGVAHVRRRRAERVRGGRGESPGARTHFVEVEHVERRAEVVEQLLGGDAVECDGALRVAHGGLGPDRGDAHGVSLPCSLTR